MTRCSVCALLLVCASSSIADRSTGEVSPRLPEHGASVVRRRLKQQGHADDRLNVTLGNNVWDVEYGKGDWAYLATNPLERARLGVIYSSFYQPLASKHHLLDVGCGEGGLSDLFPRHSAQYYHGIDVSGVAIAEARRKRRAFDFQHSNAVDYRPNGTATKFKMIVFSEMIYYINHTVVVPHYATNYLEPGGAIVITQWGDSEDAIRKSQISQDMAALFTPREAVFISGMTANPSRKVTFRASFLISAYSVAPVAAAAAVAPVPVAA